MTIWGNAEENLVLKREKVKLINKPNVCNALLINKTAQIQANVASRVEVLGVKYTELV